MKIPVQINVANSTCNHEHKKTEHHYHDDAEEKAHVHAGGPGPARPRLAEHNDDHPAHNHEHHDDVVSLAHRHHDHQHPIHLMQGAAGFRQHSCHAGDGHNHGESQPAATGGFVPMRASLGGGGHHHHEEGEHEHCPHCDEHLADGKCDRCGYKHEH